VGAVVGHTQNLSCNKQKTEVHRYENAALLGKLGAF
jgi:hypothetical protein